jgi:hypothetical protein
MDTLPFSEKIGPFQKHLQNQYAGLHHLEVTTTVETISIYLKLPLYSSDLIILKNNTLVDEVSEPV